MVHLRRTAVEVKWRRLVLESALIEREWVLAGDGNKSLLSKRNESLLRVRTST